MKAGTLIVDISLSVARLQQDVGQAKSLVEDASREMSRSIGAVKSAFAALGVSLGVGYFANVIRETIAWEAELGRLAQRTGSTVEAISALSGVAKRSNTDMEAVGQGLQKLAKSMAESGDGTSKAAKIFDALKISVTDAGGGMRGTQDVMRELGSKLMSMRDQTLAVAFAQEVLGKSGANLLPFLYELATAGTQQAKVTTEQAKAAKEFEDNLARLRSSSEQYRNHLANELLPTLDMLVQKMNAIKSAEGGGFVGFMAKLGLTGEQASSPVRALDEVSTKLAELRRMRKELDPGEGRLLDLTTGNAVNKLNEFIWGDRFDLDNQIKYAEKQQQILRTLAQSRRGRYYEDAAGNVGPEAAIARTDVKNPLKDQTEKDYYDQMSRQVGERTALLEAELSATRPLTEAQKEMVKIQADLSAGYKTLTPEQRRQIEFDLTYADVVDQEVRAKQDAKKLDLEIFNARRSFLAQEEQVIASTTEEIRHLRERNEEIGLTTEELGKLRLARIDEQIATLERDRMVESLGGDDAEIRNMDRKIAQLREIRSLTADGTLRTSMEETRKRTQEEFDRTADHIERTLSQALVTGFMDGGKSGAEVLKRAVESTFATLVLEPILKPILMPIAQFAAGVSQAIFGSMGAGAVGSVTGGAAGGASSGLLGAGAGFLARLGFGGSALQVGGPGTGAVTYTNAGGATAGASSGAAATTGFAALALGDYMSAQNGRDWLRTLYGGAPPMAGKINEKLGIPEFFTDPLGAVFGHGGGPKTPQIGIMQAGGRFWVGQSDLLSQQEADTKYASLNALLNDPRRYDPSTLSGLTGLIPGGVGMSADQMLALLTQHIAGAEQPDPNVLRGQRLSAVTQLKGLLGVDSLQQFRDSLKVSDLAGGSPLDQVSAARDIFQRDFGAVRAGDFSRLGAFEQEAQQYLQLGRGVYASGQDYQNIYSEVSAALDSVTAKQTELLQDLPSVLMQNSQDQIAAIKAQTEELVTTLKDVGSKIDRLRAAGVE